MNRHIHLFVVGALLASGVVMAGACVPMPHFNDPNLDGRPDCLDTHPEILLGPDGQAPDCAVDPALALGECGKGIMKCEEKNGESVPVCVSKIEKPTDELEEPVCNRLDDDCDGSVDEGCACNPGQTEDCGIGLGICELVKRACGQDGKWPECAAKRPEKEVCDNIDNNCDGVTDEDYPEKGTACKVVANQGVCRDGVWTCILGTLTCKVPDPVSEVCNELDDDCDGQIDEDLIPPKGSLCDDGKLSVCKGTGVYVCDSVGGIVCSITDPGVPPSVEVCDGKDNDCDGTVDDNVSSPEVCDGKDNDCNGHIDDVSGIDGKRCEQCVPLQNIPVFPLLLINGDPEFDGHGPFVKMSVTASCSANVARVKACVDMIEVPGQNTIGSGCTELLVNSFPHTVQCGEMYTTSYTDMTTGTPDIGSGDGSFVVGYQCNADRSGADVCLDPPFSLSTGNTCSGCAFFMGCLNVKEIP